MKILLVANGYPPSAYGGVELYTQGIAQNLQRAGHAVRVFCRESDPDQPDGTVLQDERDGIPVTRVVNDFKAIASFPATFIDPEIERVFRDELEADRPDVVHFNHWIALSASLSHVSHDAKIPSVATLHDFWPLCQRVHLLDWRRRQCPGPRQGGDCYRCVVGSARPRALLLQFLRWGKRSTLGRLAGGVRRRVRSDSLSVVALTGTREDFETRYEIFRASLERVEHVLTPSEYVRHVFQANGYDTARFQVLPLGIEPQIAPPGATRPHVPLRIGYIGSVIPAKGLLVLLQALGAIPAARLELEAYGRSDADPAYTRRVQKWAGRDRRVHLRGPFAPETKPDVYSGLDLLVIPSIVPESFSLVAREALLNSVPVLAARAGALPEIIQDGANGWLFEPGDAAGLANLLERFTDDPTLLKALGLPGPTPILTRQEHVERLLSVYRAAVKD